MSRNGPDPRPAGARGRGPACLALVLLLAAAGCGPKTFTDLVDREPLPYSEVDMSGAGSPALAAIYKLGMAHYQSGDWPAAIDQLARADRMLEADPRGGPPNQPLFQPFVRMYLGVARMQAGQVADALAVFDQLAAPETARPLRERGLWYGAQCRLLQGDGAGALRQLEELGGSPVYAQLSRDLVERVRKRL